MAACFAYSEKYTSAHLLFPGTHDSIERLKKTHGASLLCHSVTCAPMEVKQEESLCQLFL